MPKLLKDKPPTNGANPSPPPRSGNGLLQSPESKETAGVKIQRFLSSQDGYRAEAADVLVPVFRDLEKIINKIREEQKANPRYYIVTHSQKNPMLGGALHIRTFWRQTEPKKAFNLDCYRVTNPGDQFELVWCIPSEAVCRAVAANPSVYDPRLARWCVEFLKPAA